MSTLLQRGYRLLNRAMEPAAAESVRYLRGAVAVSDAMPALLSAPQIEQIADGGVAIVGRQFTWLLKRAELMLEGQQITPHRSDRIEWDSNGRTYVFEVLPDIGSPESGAVDPRLEWIPASTKLERVQ